MKKTLALAAMLSALYCSAQTAEYYYDGNEQYTQSLHEFPTDSTRLLQSRYVISMGQYQEYHLEEITNGILSPITIPLCTQMTSAPIEVDGGFVFSGLTANNGNELFFFDGVNSNLFDLNPGALGSGYIGLYEIDDELFFTAIDGVGNQAYKFIDGTTVEKITVDSAYVSAVTAVWGDAVYYTELDYDAGASTYTYSLKKALWNGVDYDYSLVKDVVVPTNFDFYWTEPVIKWNKLFLSETKYDFQQIAPTELSVISVTDTDVAATLYSTTSPQLTRTQIFELNNDVYFFVGSTNELHSSQDGLSFSVAETLSGNDVFTQLKVVDGDVHFIVADFNNGSTQLFAYDGSLTPLYSGTNLWFSIDEDGLMYFSDYNYNAQELYIHSIDLGNYDLTSVFVGDGNIGFYEDAALIFEDRFTFVYEAPSNGGTTSDVLQIVDVNALSEVLTTNVSIYPNPVIGGDAITVETDMPSSYDITTIEGKVLASGELSEGTNTIVLSALENLESGVYLILLNSTSYRIVIE